MSDPIETNPMPRRAGVNLIDHIETSTWTEIWLMATFIVLIGVLVGTLI